MNEEKRNLCRVKVSRDMVQITYECSGQRPLNAHANFDHQAALQLEVYRAKNKGDKLRERLGRTFWDWGIPTPVSVVEANVGLELIATGGIRNGIDVARALVLGANSAGMAGALLEAATQSSENVIELLEGVIHELKATMFLTGARSVAELKKQEVGVTGRTREWMEQVVAR